MNKTTKWSKRCLCRVPNLQQYHYASTLNSREKPVAWHKELPPPLGLGQGDGTWKTPEVHAYRWRSVSLYLWVKNNNTFGCLLLLLHPMLEIFVHLDKQDRIGCFICCPFILRSLSPCPVHIALCSCSVLLYFLSLPLSPAQKTSTYGKQRIMEQAKGLATRWDIIVKVKQQRPSLPIL